MNCPYCGKPMEAGWIPNAAYSVVWLPENVNQKFRLYLDTEKLEKLNGVVLRSLELRIQKRGLPAFLCRECHKVVIDYEEGQVMLI